MQGEHRAAPASSGASHRKQQAWKPSSCMALRGMDMFVRFGMAPEVMNPWTRGFKMHPLVVKAWANGTRGRTFWTTTRSETPALHHEFIAFINTKRRMGPSISKPHRLSPMPSCNFSDKTHGRNRSITRAACGTSVMSKNNTCGWPWGRSRSPLVSCVLVALVV